MTTSAPTYGGELLAARDHLDSVIAALGPHHQFDDSRHLIATLHQLYRQLYRHVFILSRSKHDPLLDALALAVKQRNAELSSTSIRALPDLVGNAAEHAVQAAADHVGVAAEIMFSHLAPDSTALSPAGFALLAGVNRTAHVAALAALTAITTRLEQHRTGLRPAGTRLSALQKLEEATQQHQAPNGPSYLSELRAAAHVSADGWPPVTDHASFAAALDAGRTWMAQHYATDLTGQQVRHILGAGLGLVNGLSYLTVHLRNDIATELGSQHGASTWRNAYQASDNIISLHHDTTGAGPSALLQAERWLRQQLRVHGQWRTNVVPHPATTGHTIWSNTAKEIARSLPDLASMVLTGLKVATRDHHLYSLDPFHGQKNVVQQPQWRPASARTPAVRGLIMKVGELREASETMSGLLHVTPHPGIHEAAQARRLSTQSALDIAADTTSTITRRRDLGYVTPAAAARLPEATSALADRLRKAHTRQKDPSRLTRLPVPLAQNVVDEVQQLLARIGRLETEIADLRLTVAVHDDTRPALAFSESEHHDTLPIADADPDTDLF